MMVPYKKMILNDMKKWDEYEEMAMFLGGVPHFQAHPILIYHHQTILESKTLDFFPHLPGEGC